MHETDANWCSICYQFSAAHGTLSQGVNFLFYHGREMHRAAEFRFSAEVLKCLVIFLKTSFL